MSKRVWVTPICCFLLFCPIVQAQQPEEDLQKQIEELKKGQAEIRKELADIKRLLQDQPANGPHSLLFLMSRGRSLTSGTTPSREKRMPA